VGLAFAPSIRHRYGTEEVDMIQKVTPAMVDRDELRVEIKAKYTEVALEPEKGFHFHTGRALARMLGYADEIVEWVPRSAVESFAGTGNPLSMGALKPGETVLDIGCGAGFDTLQAARQVGPSGKVIAVDMTEAMLAQTRSAAASLDLANIEPRLGYAEELPVTDESVDVVISNGVINLTPDKAAVLREIRRVLKPGGRFQISDIAVRQEVPQDAKDDINLWSSCIAGALLDAEWRWLLDNLGYSDLRWGMEVDVFSGSLHESDAAEFDTRGVTFAGRKPEKH
jgi:arsenite methyltransferase